MECIDCKNCNRNWKTNVPYYCEFHMAILSPYTAKESGKAENCPGFE